MSRNLTQPTDTSVQAYLDAIDDPARRADCEVLMHRMQSALGEPAVMWGSSIVGFGSYHYVYDSGREGDWCLAGFSSRKAAISIYVMAGVEDFPEHMAKLGKYKTGKSCLYVKKLADIDLDVLDALVVDSAEQLKARYPSD